MTLITPRKEETSAALVSEADKQFQEAAELLALVMQDIRAGKIEDVKLAAEAMRELRKTFQVAMDERMRIEKLGKQDAGIVNDYALDFDAARTEISRRLARLREAGNG